MSRDPEWSFTQHLNCPLGFVLGFRKLLYYRVLETLKVEMVLSGARGSFSGKAMKKLRFDVQMH